MGIKILAGDFKNSSELDFVQNEGVSRGIGPVL